MASTSAKPTALGLLIREVQVANKWSYADIAHNAVTAGRKLSKSRVESLRNDALPSISVKAIEALAAGLKVSPDRVARVAMESMGYAVEAADAHPADVLAGDPALSDPMRRVLLAALAAAHEEFDSAIPATRPKRRGPGGAGNVFQRSAADDDTSTAH